MANTDKAGRNPGVIRTWFYSFSWIPAKFNTSPQRRNQGAALTYFLSHFLGSDHHYQQLIESFPHNLSSLLRSEAAEMGGSTWRLDPGPGRQVPPQEEDHIQEEEDGWRKTLWEEKVAAGAVPELHSVLSGWPGFVVPLPDAIHARPLIGLVVNWEEKERKLVLTGSQSAVCEWELIFLVQIWHSATSWFLEEAAVEHPTIAQC